MFYYVVPSITTTDESGMTTTKPDIPDGTPFVGSPMNGDFLIATPVELLSLIQVPDLGAECIARGLAYSDVLKWNVGEG